MMNRKIVVIGGSAAGPKAAAKARRTDEAADITLIQKGADLSMASCGYPYYVGGVFDNRNMLLATPAGVIRDPGFFKKVKNINALPNTEVTKIDRDKKLVHCRSLLDASTFTTPYDKLIIATGCSPRIPNVEGIELDGISTLLSMKDADYLRKIRDEKSIKKAVVVGGGLIGIETCEALQLAGIEVTIIEMLPQLLTFLDKELAQLVQNHISSKSVNIVTDNGVKSFLGKDGKLTAVKLQNGTELPCELAVIAIGVTPNSSLAAEAGLQVGQTGGIVTDEYMRTSDQDIYAAGDCVEVTHRITGSPVHAPFGDLANLEGRVAGENAASDATKKFGGTIHTGICKIFDFSAGSTGLSAKMAQRNGIKNIETVINASPDCPVFMGGKLLVSKLMVDKDNRQILGYQCVGPGDVSKQLASAAMAIMGKLTIEDIANADLPYAPPFSLAIDHFIASAHIMQNKLCAALEGISCEDVFNDGCDKKSLFILDVRSPAEFEEMRLGIKEVLIPLGALRTRLSDLPEDKSTPIVCYCKISLRGYEAALIIKAAGWTNVRVMEGGIMAWPYPKEK